MRKNMLIISTVLLLIVVAVAIFNPDLLKNVWLWLVGFAGFIFKGIQGLGSLFQSDQKLKDIASSNETIKQNYARIREELEEARQQLQQEREAHRAEIQRLQSRLSQQQNDYRALQKDLQHLQTASYQEYMESLSAEEKRRMESDIWGGVDFGL
jgi:predicted nuclease with TOPRIM domain